MNNYRYSSQTAIIYKNKRITYKELVSYSINLSELITNSCGKGKQPLGIFLPNSSDYAVAFFAVAYSDNVVVPLADPNNQCFEDVIRALYEHYNVECRVAGNTVSYRHPEYKDKNGKLVSVRGSKLGDLYTKRGIMNAITEKQSIATEYGRQSDAYTAEHELIRATAGLSEFVGEDSSAQGGRQAVGRGQVSGVAAPCNDGKALQDFDRLYDRYRKRASENEQRTDEADKCARAVQKRNKNRGR